MEGFNFLCVGDGDAGGAFSTQKKKKKNRINQENLSKGIPIEINYDLISLKWLSFLFLSFFFSCLAGAFHTSFNAVCMKEFIGGNGTKSLHLGGE